MNKKVWMVIGGNDDLSNATARYLTSRDQVVIHLPDFNSLGCVIHRDTVIDKLIVNNIQPSDLDHAFENVNKLSPHLPTDGTGQIIFVSSNGLCVKELMLQEAFLVLQRKMKNQSIEVHCFEPLPKERSGNSVILRKGTHHHGSSNTGFKSH